VCTVPFLTRQVWTTITYWEDGKTGATGTTVKLFASTYAEEGFEITVDENAFCERVSGSGELDDIDPFDEEEDANEYGFDLEEINLRLKSLGPNAGKVWTERLFQRIVAQGGPLGTKKETRAMLIVQNRMATKEYHSGMQM
jgi:hypothetical protein